jgi:transposase-like protein
MNKRNKVGGIKSQKGQDIPELSENDARAHIEKLLWPDGQPVCRHCGSANVYRMHGATCRPGLCRCRDCKKQFTVTVGTIFEDSHIPLAKWVRGIHMMAASKKGISSLQLMRNLGLGSYQSAWFMSHRIRLAMSKGPAAGLLKGTVQVDEAYIGGKPRPGTGPHKRGRGTAKAPVMVLVEKDGRAHSRHVGRVDGSTVKAAIREMVDPSATIHTDELAVYNGIGEHFAGGHQSVNHAAGQYVGPNGETTNTAESYFALLKRGVIGTFHHVSKTHLPRYCDEFSFRWNGRKNSDAERRDETVVGAEGKRLMFRQPAA